MSKREKTYVLVTIVLVLMLLMKSTLIDPYKTKNNDEELFKVTVEEVLAEEYDGFLYDNNIIKMRVIKIYKDDGKYYAKVRKYFLSVLPYSDFKVVDQAEGEIDES